MKLYIRNMVCDRCKMAVSSELEAFGLDVRSVALGEAEISEEKLTDELKQRLNERLMDLGFELIDDRKSKIVELVKNLIIQHIHYSDHALKTNLSDYIAEQLAMDYSYISNLFTEMKGTTIEQYAIAQKIERAKELLAYGEYTFGEIAFQLHYSSASHFTRQFKKVTGLTPSYFRQLKSLKRISLDKL